MANSENEEQYPSIQDMESGSVRRRREHNTPYDVRMTAWKNLVQSNPGRVLRISDFDKAAKTTTASHHINNLLAEGILTRQRVDMGSGIYYSYEWNEEAEQKVQQALATLTPTSNVESISLTNLDSYAQEFNSKNASDSDEQIAALKNLGVTQFVDYIKDKMSEHAGVDREDK